MLRNKIAATIASMKNKETTQLNESFNGPQNNCFIERTKVSKGRRGAGVASCLAAIEPDDLTKLELRLEPDSGGAHRR